MELPELRRSERQRCAHPGAPAGRGRPEVQMAAGASTLSGHTDRHHLRLADRGPARVLSTPRGRESGQVMVLVAGALLALIAAAALILVAGSVEWQKNQLQELADSAALDSAVTIGAGCDTAKASAVITRVNTFL